MTKGDEMSQTKTKIANVYERTTPDGQMILVGYSGFFKLVIERNPDVEPGGPQWTAYAEEVPPKQKNEV